MDTNQIKNKSEANIFQCTDEKYNTSKYKEYKKILKFHVIKKWWGGKKTEIISIMNSINRLI
jgi:hypothetical protein